MAIDDEVAGSRTPDVHVVPYRQLAAGQLDGLAGQAAVKLDGVAVVSAEQGGAQRSAAGITVIRDRQNTGRGPIFKRLHAWQKPFRKRASMISVSFGRRKSP